LDSKYKISVIVCIYNERECLLTALKSLRNNYIYNETEIILIDDCSTDLFTQKILLRLKRFTSFKIIKSDKNLGLSNSRNLGFHHSSTDLILPLDADDELPPKTLDIIYKIFLENPHIDFIVGDYYLNNLDTNEINLIECQDITTNNIIDAKKLSSNWKLLGTSPCKKKAWQKIGGYDLEYSYTIQDVDFWIRIIQSGCIGVYLNTPIYKWNRSSTGMNSSLKSLMIINILQKHLNFYLLSQSKKHLYNKIFEANYPFKQVKTINNLTKRYFFKLKLLNQIRSIYILFISIFKKNE